MMNDQGPNWSPNGALSNSYSFLSRVRGGRGWGAVCVVATWYVRWTHSSHTVFLELTTRGVLREICTHIDTHTHTHTHTHFKSGGTYPTRTYMDFEGYIAKHVRIVFSFICNACASGDLDSGPHRTRVSHRFGVQSGSSSHQVAKQIHPHTHTYHR